MFQISKLGTPSADVNATQISYAFSKTNRFIFKPVRPQVALSVFFQQHLDVKQLNCPANGTVRVEWWCSHDGPGNIGQAGISLALSYTGPAV